MAKRTIELDPPELTDEQLAQMRPARDVLTPEQFAAVSSVRKAGRPKIAVPKVPITIRLDADTAARLRASGAGWQTRVSEVLRRYAADADLPRKSKAHA